MSYVLDTHIVIWLANDPNRINDSVKDILQDIDLDIYFSAVNLWEIVIKNQLNKSDFRIDAAELYQNLLDHDFVELPVLSKHTVSLENLPMHHKDPFDRLLIAQAASESFALITHDASIWQYENIEIVRA